MSRGYFRLDHGGHYQNFAVLSELVSALPEG